MEKRFTKKKKLEKVFTDYLRLSADRQGSTLKSFQFGHPAGRQKRNGRTSVEEDVKENTAVDSICKTRPTISLHLIPLLIKMKHKFEKKARHNRYGIRRRQRVTSILDYLENKTKNIIIKNVQTLRQICFFNPCRNGSNGCVK